jgi:antitoxin (DNA-binding transcriptional repressor) of toxin-antitoxin stability system
MNMPGTVSISEAKQRLGAIADRALQGEQIVIVRKTKLLVLRPLELPEPVPLRPPGYFDDCYDKAAARESNKLAARSARRIVK